MIEIKLQPAGFPNSSKPEWRRASPQLKVHIVNFNHIRVRIDGIEYTKHSAEFSEEFNRAKMWMLLEND